MNVSINSFGISDLDSFINIHASASDKEHRVFFVRGIGCADSLCDKLKTIDAKVSSDKNYSYRRINGFPPFKDGQAAEHYIGMYENISADREVQLLKGISDEQINRDFREACRKVCGDVRAARQNFSPTMEKNLGAVLVYWADMFLTDLLKSSGRFRKLICSGRIDRNEYAFCYLAVLMGVDVCILLPNGDINIGGGLMNRSSAFVIGAPRDITLPDFSPAPAAKTPEQKPKVDLARPPRPPRQQPGRVSASPTSNSSSPGKSYTVDLTRPPKQKPPSAAAPAPVRPSVQTSPHTSAAPRRELSYEELAALAESVVLIEVHNRFGVPVGTGSGIVINDRGYILTNCHVANGGTSYSVRIENDDNSYPAYNVIKYHPLLDLAVIRIDKHIKPLTVYNGSVPLNRGQRVVAIGSPLGLFNSVSDGIISGFRTVNDIEMIQFTAPISHGSSGGAVLNMYGEVIGISTAGIEGGQNINLAVGYRDIVPFIGNFV